MRDTDGNGVSDGDEKVAQKVEETINEEERPEVKKVTVEFEESGNIKESTTIENVYHVDMLSSDVAGLIGVPIEIETESEFEIATITFYYNVNKLGKTKEEDLAVLWYVMEM